MSSIFFLKNKLFDKKQDLIYIHSYHIAGDIIYGYSSGR